jgi:hypothetical protein
MHQDCKTLTVLFAPDTQQLAILDITHVSCANAKPKRGFAVSTRVPVLHPGIVIAVGLLGLLSFCIR